MVFNNDEVDGIENVYHLNLDDSEITQLTESEWDEMRAVWSLDGETILYVLDENDALPSGTLTLYLMNPDGTEQRPLADEIFEGGAMWTADGRYMVYMSNINGTWQTVFARYRKQPGLYRDGRNERCAVPGMATLTALHHET